MVNEAKTSEEQKLGELLNLQAAFRSSGQDVPAKLSMEILSLAGTNSVEQEGSEQQRDKQKQHMEARIAALVSYGISQEMAARHIQFAEYGFASHEDIQEYGGMLDDKKYRDFLMSDTPEAKAERAKIVNGMTEMVEEGKTTMKELERNLDKGANTPEGKAAAKNILGDVREVLRDRGHDVSSKDKSTSNEIAKMLAPVNGLNAQERVDDLAVKTNKVSQIDQSSLETFAAHEESNREERRETAKEIRQEVYAKAETNGVETSKKEFSETEDDDLAALFDEPENKVAANTLKKAQEDVKAEPISKPSEVQIAENSKAAEKASTETGLA